MPPEKVSLVVAGTPEGPDPSLSAAAVALIERADELRQSIAEYLAGNPVEMHSKRRLPPVVHPQRPSVDIVQIELRDAGRPETAHVFVVTGYPDPYYLYDVSLDGRSLTGVVGGFW